MKYLHVIILTAVFCFTVVCALMLSSARTPVIGGEKSGGTVFIRNPTSDFLGIRDGVAKAEIQLFDVQALWGGRDITIDTDGKTAVTVVRRGGSSKNSVTYQLTLNQADIDRLLGLFVTNDFVTIKIKERAGVPDESHPRIVLKNAKGEERSVGKWANDKNARFDAIYNALLDIEKLAVK